MKVMALDFGTARTGVAVSDPTGVIARPLCVIERAADRGESPSENASARNLPRRRPRLRRHHAGAPLDHAR